LTNSNVVPPTRDWRSVIGISEMTDFSRDILAEMAANREADRREFGERSCRARAVRGENAFISLFVGVVQPDEEEGVGLFSEAENG
jgi:hypothetical protein